MRRHRILRRLRLLLLLALCAVLSACGAKQAAPAVRVLLDGEAWDGAALPSGDGELRVYVTLDGRALIDLPFGEARTVTVVQPEGEENVIALTGDSVYMLSANCENQDCVQMGAVTPENLELRVLGGFIVCLPHRLSVEVRGQ